MKKKSLYVPAEEFVWNMDAENALNWLSDEKTWESYPRKKIERIVVAFMKKLSKSSEGINYTDERGRRIPHIFPCSPEILKAYVELGGDISSQSSVPYTHYSTPLHYFFRGVIGKDIHSDKKHFSKIRDGLKTKTGRNYFYELFKLYLELGADPNDPKFSIATVFAEHLLQFSEANGNFPQDKEYVKRMLDLACEYNVNLTLADDSFSPVCVAMKNVDLLQEFIKRGVDLNHTYIEYHHYEGFVRMQAPLRFALEKEILDIVKILLEAGADPNLKLPETGQTACVGLLKFGCNCGDYVEDALRLLSEYGADFNIIDNSGGTILHWSYEENRVDDYDVYCPVKTLIELGAKPIADNEGNTPLHIYVQRRPANDTIVKEDIKALIEAGNDVNAANDNGETPFGRLCKVYDRNAGYHDFPREEYIDLLKTLVKEGADIYALDQSGKTAIEPLPQWLQKELINYKEYIEETRAMVDYDIDAYER